MTERKANPQPSPWHGWKSPNMTRTRVRSERDQEAYESYVAYCGRIGVPPATLETWQRCSAWSRQIS